MYGIFPHLLCKKSSILNISLYPTHQEHLELSVSDAHRICTAVAHSRYNRVMGAVYRGLPSISFAERMTSIFVSDDASNNIPDCETEPKSILEGKHNLLRFFI